MNIKFIKMQALGNDFIFIENIYQNLLSKEIIQKLCHRKLGIGCDQLLTFAYDEKDLKVTLKIYNRDGSEATVCGNAFRCITQYLCKKHNLQQLTLTVKNRTYFGSLNADSTISINMGQPFFSHEHVGVQINEYTLDLKNIIIDGLDSNKYSKPFALSVGNPHVVLFTSSVAVDDEVQKYGYMLENHPYFINRTNANFATVLDENTVYLKTWERGTGQTLACGSGACATFVAAHKQGLITKKDTIIKMDGGELLIGFSNKNDIIMTGSAKFVYTGITQ